MLHNYWLQNAYYNKKEFVVPVMLTPALNIKLTSKWHKTTKQEKLALVP